MTHTFSASYLPCRHCTAKVNCEKCESRLEEALMRIQNINRVSVQIAAKQVLIDGAIHRDEAEDVLEELGIFIS